MNDRQTKHCKYCCAEINRRARVSPICHRSITFLGGITTLLLTIFPILIAAASLAIAIMVRVERAAVQETLAKTETRLGISEIRNEVAADAITGLIRIAPKLRTATGPDADDVEENERAVKEEMQGDNPDLDRLRELERQRLNAQSGRDLFGEPPQ